MMPCYRVPLYVQRRDQLGQTRTVQRTGPIVEAATPEEAIEKARTVMAPSLDFVAVGVPEFLHDAPDHSDPRFTYLPRLLPALSPAKRKDDRYLDEHLIEMAAFALQRTRAKRARKATQ